MGDKMTKTGKEGGGANACQRCGESAAESCSGCVGAFGAYRPLARGLIYHVAEALRGENVAGMNQPIQHARGLEHLVDAL